LIPVFMYCDQHTTRLPQLIKKDYLVWSRLDIPAFAWSDWRKLRDISQNSK